MHKTMKQGIFELIENTALTGKVSRLRLRGDVSGITVPGQFVQVQIEGLFLRRPFSVCDRDENSFTVLYENIGAGTDILHAAVEKEDQSVFVLFYKLNDTVFVTIKETAVATCTVIH